MKNWQLLILVVILSFMCGFLLRGKLMKPGEETIITIEKPIKDTIFIPEPVSITTPTKPLLPTKLDTVYVQDILYQVQVVDTAAIIADYILQRDYAFNLFQNEYGKLDIKNTVQYNTLTNLEYTFTPTVKHTIKTPSIPLFTPFAMIQYNTSNTLSAGGGLFIGNIGGYYNYNLHLNHIPTHSFGVIYKFQ